MDQSEQDGLVLNQSVEVTHRLQHLVTTVRGELQVSKNWMVLKPREEALHNVDTELLVRKPCPSQITGKLIQISLQLSKAYENTPYQKRSFLRPPLKIYM